MSRTLTASLFACLLGAASCGGGSSTTTPTGPSQTGATTTPNVSTQACRTYATSSTTVTNTSAGASNTRTLSCSFDTIANQLKCTINISTCGSASFFLTYASRGDFVDEISAIPPRMLQMSQTTASNPCGIGSATYVYDGAKRLVSYSINGLTYSYSAWDANGRPTTGQISGAGTAVTESWSYNDAARTANLIQSNAAGSTNTTYSYDASGNPVSVVVQSGATVSTSITTTSGTDKVCK